MITKDPSVGDKIELTNVGPIKHISIPCPDGGGLVVLKGDNDLGKSETLDAIDAAINDRGGIEVRRGCVSGQMSAFGVNVKIGKRITRTGEAVVESLEGRFSIEDLIEPKIKDPIAADAKRIKTLIQVTGKKATPELFYPLLGSREEFESIVSTDAVQSEDFVVMAEKIKRCLESEARKLEEKAKHEDGHAQGALAATAGVDMTAEADAIKLQSAHERAVRRDSDLTAQMMAHKRAKITAQKASDAISDAEVTYAGPSLAEAVAIEAKAKEKSDALQADVRALEAELLAKKNEWAAARTEYSHAIEKRKNSETHESTITQWREQLAASIPPAPSDADIVAAAEAVTVAREALERGAIIRRAYDAKATADRHAKLATEHRQKSMRLRDAARGTDDILSSLVATAGTPLRVEAGRLMMDATDGPKTFAERSHGTRSRIALDIAIEAVGPGGVICLKQEFYEGISPHRKRELAAHLKGRGVLVLTAQASDDPEIVAEVV